MADSPFSPGAFWIGSAHPFDLHEAYLCFRRVFELERTPAAASLYITADSRYKLWVNGRYIARGPARSYPESQSYDEHDLAAALQAGPNSLAVQVYQPGYSHFSYAHRGAAGLLAALHCDGQEVLATDPRWRVQRDPSFQPLVPRVSIYGSGVELRQLAREEDWTAPSWDDSAWPAARIVAPVGAYPWLNLQPRNLQLLVERDQPLQLLQTRRGRQVPTPEHDAASVHLALGASWGEAGPAGLADAGGWFSPKLAAGESAFWLFALPRDFAVQGWAEVEAARGEEELAVSYIEQLRAGAPVISDPATYCRMRLTDSFHLRAGTQRAESFALRGGRYLLFQLNGPTGPDLRIRFHARVAEYPIELKHEFHPSDPELDTIAVLCENSLRACLLDGLIDNPWRESAQWTGDALPQALALSALTDDTRPLRRVIELASQRAYPDGMLPSVIPSDAHAYTCLDYGLMWIELLELYWRLARDRQFVSAHWDTLGKLLSYYQSHQDGSGLLLSEPGRRLFLDWAPVSRAEPNAIYDLHYLLALRRATALARGLDDRTRAREWQARADHLKTAAREAFWRAGRWYDDAGCSTFSQLAAALALLSGAVEDAERAPLLDALAARSLDPGDAPLPGQMVLASPFMHYYVFEALCAGGAASQVIEIIRRRWGRWADSGEPTAWENWNVDFPDASQCHAFAAHPLYFLSRIASGRAA